MSALLDVARYVLIDLDGVLYRGTTALDAADTFIEWLREHDLRFRLVTNNSTLTPAQYVDKLARMSIAVSVDEIFTSALATALYLRSNGEEKSSVYVIGEVGLCNALQDIGMQFTEDRPDWVVVGLDRTVTYEKLKVAALGIASGAKYLGSNPDTSLPTEDGIVPGAGALQAALTATTGVRPIVIGKPEPLMLQLAMNDLGSTPADTVMLGDRLDTDIMAAHTIGIPSVMVLTGVSTRADLLHSEIQPTLVVEDLQQLMEVWPIPLR